MIGFVLVDGQVAIYAYRNGGFQAERLLNRIHLTNHVLVNA